MFWDYRLLGANSTNISRNEWAADVWPQIELIWAFMILLHFAALLPIDPLVLHLLSVLLKLINAPASPRTSSYEELHCIQL
jgi:hypothetical protein